MRKEINERNDELVAKKIIDMWEKEVYDSVKKAEEGWKKRREFLLKKKEEAQNPLPTAQRSNPRPQQTVNFTPSSARHRSTSTRQLPPSTPHPNRPRQRSRSMSSSRLQHQNRRSFSRNGRGRRNNQRQQLPQQRQRPSRSDSRGRSYSRTSGNRQSFRSIG